MGKIISQLSVLLDLDSQKFQAGLQNAKAGMSKFALGMKEISGTLSGLFSVAAITAFTVKAIESYSVQQAAEIKLLTALKNRESVQKSLIDDASKLQRVTLFGDENIIEAYAQLAVFEKNEDALKRLMPLVMDMATVLKMELTQAAMLVGKSIGSTTNALKRYGIEINGAVGSSERLDNLITALSDKFGGQALAATNTLTAELQQLKKAFGELTETAGQLVSGEEGKGIIGIITDQLYKLNEIASDIATQGNLLDKILIVPNTSIRYWLDLIRGGKKETDDWNTSAGRLGETFNEMILTFASPELAKPIENFAASSEFITRQIEKTRKETQKFAENIKLASISFDEIKESNLLTEASLKRMSALEFVAKSRVTGRQIIGDKNNKPGTLALRNEFSIEQARKEWFKDAPQIIEWASIAETAFMNLGEAMAQAFQKGANFGEIFLELLIKMTALIAGTAIGGPVGSMIGGLIGGFGGNMFGGMISSGGGGSSFASKINYSGGYNAGEWRIKGEDLVYIVNKQQDKLNRYR